MDPNDFILLDLCLTTFTRRPSATPSTTTDQNGDSKDPAPGYQADWSSPPFSGTNGLANAMEKMALEEESIKNSPHSRPSIPGLLYSAGGGFQCQRRIYLLQAGEEPPDVLLLDEKDQTRSPTSPYYPLYIETINEILDLKLPKNIETKRLAVLREEWISKAKQFHNLYKAGCASDESVLNRFLVSMKVNRQDLKILRFFTRCARVTTHTQKYCSQVSGSMSSSSVLAPNYDFEVDHLVIGAGVVGLAIAERLAARGGSTLIVDKNDAAGQETSSRNSEVIHAGLYYPTDSLKTRLCIRGNQLLYELCDKYNIEHQQITKWVVAQTESDLAYLENLSKKAHQLLLPTTRMPGSPTYMLTQKEMKAQEPHIHGLAALVSPRTGIIDVHGLMQFLEMRIQEHGGDLVLQCQVTGIERLGSAATKDPAHSRGSFKVEMMSPAGPVVAKAATVINSAGLHSDKILQMLHDSAPQDTSLKALAPYKLHYCKGHYYSYSGPSLVSRLIYPVPDKNLAGLGTHLTLDLAGRMRFGPDILYVDSNDDYSIDEEVVGSRSSMDAVAKVIQTYLPRVDASSLYPDYAGIRPKLAGPGEPFRDFEIERLGGFVNLAGIESPGLTSSLAIAEYVEQMLV
ncbi:hypothetical protein CPC16_006583 [Podila verticillata]|nr:hypothetical protein CPC16_006583 [Podila verticillata]